MIKQMTYLALASLAFLNLHAQKGKNEVSINAEATVPVFQNDHGFGLFVKGFYGVGRSAQLTASVGVSKFKNQNSIEVKEVKTRLIPFYLGYKQNFRRLYIEPRIGIGEMGGRIEMDGDYSRPSVAALFGGVEAGYHIKRVDVGINFQTVHGLENSSAGLWHNENFHYTSIYLGYHLFSK